MCYWFPSANILILGIPGVGRGKGLAEQFCVSKTLVYYHLVGYDYIIYGRLVSSMKYLKAIVKKESDLKKMH